MVVDWTPQAAEHYYLLTEAMDDVDPSWPVLEDPSSYAYIRPEGGGLMVGLFEGEGRAWQVKQVPSTFSFGEVGHSLLTSVTQAGRQAGSSLPLRPLAI